MAEHTPTIDLTKYVDQQFFGERPHVRGRRVPVATLAAHAFHNHWDIPRLAHEFTLSEVEVLAALLYYEQHRTVIDAQETAYQAALDESFQQNA